jgi:PAS domain S-box-containing protein
MAIQRYDIRRPETGEFEVRYWSPINTPVLDSDGEVTLIIHRVEDVTDYVRLKNARIEQDHLAKAQEDRTAKMEAELVRRAEEILTTRKSLEERDEHNLHLRSIIEAMPDGVIVATPQGRITLANAKAQALYGYSEKELLDRCFSGLQSRCDADSGQSHDNRDLPWPPGAQVDLPPISWMRRKDGAEFPAHVAVNGMKIGGIDLTIYAVRDITKLVEAEEQRRSSEARYRSVLDGMLEAAQVLSFDWRYLYLNDAAAGSARQDKAEMLGQTVMERFPGFEQTEMYRVLNECMQQRTARLSEFEFVYPDGAVSWYVFSIQPVKEGLFVLALDVTDRKLSEFKIQKLNALLDQRVRDRTAELEAVNQELESFSYSISHDLRAPLRHIQGYVEMLMRSTQGAVSATAEHYMSVIAEASTEMSQLIDDLLAFSRMGRVEFQGHTVALERLAEEVVADLQLEIGARTIRWRIKPLPRAFGDEAMLKLVFSNLIGNAVKYTRGREISEIEIGALDGKGGEVVLYVKDNGAGFDMKYAHKLFGVFQRLHLAEEFEGTGIGLAIVRRVITRHGGRTWAEGELGKGATFYFSLRKAM